MDILFFINRIDGGMQGSAPQFELGFQPPVASYLIIYISLSLPKTKIIGVFANLAIINQL